MPLIKRVTGPQKNGTLKSGRELAQRQGDTDKQQTEHPELQDNQAADLLQPAEGNNSDKAGAFELVAGEAAISSSDSELSDAPEGEPEDQLIDGSKIGEDEAEDSDIDEAKHETTSADELSARSEPHSQAGPSSLVTPTPASASLPKVVDRSKGNGNTKAEPGKFFKNVWYSDPNSRLMRGSPWTEDADMVHWHLREKGLSQKSISKYMPQKEGGCQNRWQKMKAKRSELKPEDLMAAIGERERIGKLFDNGQFNLSIPLSEEAAGKEADTKKLVKVKNRTKAGIEVKGKGKEKEAVQEVKTVANAHVAAEEAGGRTI